MIKNVFRNSPGRDQYPIQIMFPGLPAAADGHCAALSRHSLDEHQDFAGHCRLLGLDFKTQFRAPLRPHRNHPS
jgi:hypothetical protein